MVGCNCILYNRTFKKLHQVHNICNRLPNMLGNTSCIHPAEVLAAVVRNRAVVVVEGNTGLEGDHMDCRHNLVGVVEDNHKQYHISLDFGLHYYTEVEEFHCCSHLLEGGTCDRSGGF